MPTGVLAGSVMRYVTLPASLPLLAMPGASSIWRFPIETVSQSESGYDRVYQSSVVFPNWQLQLAGRGSWSNQLALMINQKI